MTAEDVAYVKRNYVSLEEACAGRAETPDEIRSRAAAGELPRPSYVLPDGTEMVPADYFVIADAGRDAFEREFLAAGGSRDDVDEEWDGYLSGAYGVCLKEQTAGEHRAKGSSRQGGQRAARRTRAARQRLALPPPDGG